MKRKLLSLPTPNIHSHPHAPTQVVHVSGSDYEIGRQHALAVRDSIGEGMVEFYRRFFKHLYDAGPTRGIGKLGFRLGRLALDPLLTSRLRRQIPDFARDRLRGVADVSGRSLRELEVSLVLPDLLPLLQSAMARWVPAGFVEPQAIPHFGCTSLITAQAGFLYGRNLDFPGVGYWDRFPVLQVTRPKNGMTYIGLTTAGAPLCGITGINEAQISVALHQHYARDVSLSGRLPFLVAEEILAKATSLETAEAMLGHAKLANAWAFVVCDGKRKQGFIYEIGPRTRGILRLKDRPLTHSNYFQTDECGPRGYAATDRMNWDNEMRKCRLAENLEQAGSALTAATAVQILGEHFDPFWKEEKIVNRVVSQVFNIQSALFDMERMKLYFAEGDAPIQLGSYAEYDLGELFAGREGRTTVALPGYTFKDEHCRRAKELYVRAFIACFDGDLVSSAKWAEQSMAEAFFPEIAQATAVIYLKLGEDVKAKALLEKARSWIEHKMRASGRVHLPPEYFEILLFLARTEDILGRREPARALYRAIAHHPDLRDQNLRRIATAARAFKRDRLEQILIPFAAYVKFV